VYLFFRWQFEVRTRRGGRTNCYRDRGKSKLFTIRSCTSRNNPVKRHASARDARLSDLRQLFGPRC